MGAAGNPYLRAKARTLAAKAVQTYDPNSGVQLKTWTSQQLQRLSRLKRQSNNPVQIPERMQLENYTLEQATQRFIDEHDREPDVRELSDITRIPVKRIGDIRKSIRKMPSEAAFGEDGAIVSSESASPDFTDEALDIVYDDLDYTDRKILEMRIGYGGHEVLPPQEIARRLKLTPTQLSRRSKKITYHILRAESDLESIQ